MCLTDVNYIVAKLKLECQVHGKIWKNGIREEGKEDQQSNGFAYLYLLEQMANCWVEDVEKRFWRHLVAWVSTISMLWKYMCLFVKKEQPSPKTEIDKNTKMWGESQIQFFENGAWNSHNFSTNHSCVFVALLIFHNWKILRALSGYYAFCSHIWGYKISKIQVS